MDEQTDTIPEEKSEAPLPDIQVTEPSPEELRKQRQITLAIVGAGILILIIIIGGAIFLLSQSNDTTARIRDVFIIFMALESLVIGLVLVILVVQLARLINLLQNEIKPILDSTNETVNTLRGTTRFLSDHLAEPVIKLNEYLAGLQQIFRLVRTPRKQKQTNQTNKGE
jgi:hypothetical protein